MGGWGVLDWATALLYNGCGRYAEALAAAERGTEHDDVGVSSWALVERIEAGVRSGATDTTSAALDRLRRAHAGERDYWALGIEAGSRALLSDRRDAEPLYCEAVERLERSRGVVHLARARLLYGEWLRRENRRIDARDQLRAAHEMFSSIGAEGFAERARRELAATGETVRKRSGRDARRGSRRRRRRSPGSRHRDKRTRRSLPSYSSALAPSSTTCIRCSRSSGSGSAERASGGRSRVPSTSPRQPSPSDNADPPRPPLTPFRLGRSDPEAGAQTGASHGGEPQHETPGS